MEQTNDTLPVLVTGASRGLGAALALGLAERGHPIIAVARTVGGLEELDDRVKAIGGSTTLAPLDITHDGAMQHLCRSIHDRWGGLAMWFHTAVHAAPLTPAHFIDDKDWDKSLSVNVDATRRLICYVAPLLTSLNAQAVFFDDQRGGGKFFGAYGSTKAAQIALARSWAIETARTGPKVNIVSPAPLATATRARFYPGENRDALTTPAKAASDILSQICDS